MGLEKKRPLSTRNRQRPGRVSAQVARGIQDYAGFRLFLKGGDVDVCIRGGEREQNGGCLFSNI